MYILQLFWNLK